MRQLELDRARRIFGRAIAECQKAGHVGLGFRVVSALCGDVCGDGADWLGFVSSRTF